MQIAHGIRPPGHHQGVAAVQHRARRGHEDEGMLPHRADAHDHHVEALHQIEVHQGFAVPLLHAQFLNGDAAVFGNQVQHARIGELVGGHDRGVGFRHQSAVHVQALENLAVLLIGGLDQNLGAAQLLHVERDVQGLFHALPHADHHPVQILHVQGTQHADIGGVGLVDRIEGFLGQLHAGFGHVDAHHGMPQGNQGGGHAQAELAEADDPDFQFLFRHVFSFFLHLKQSDFSSLTRKASFL